MKSNPHCYYSIILFQLSTQFFCNHFTSSFLSLLGALGIMVSDAHLLTPLLVRCQGPKLGGSRLSLWNLHRAWVGWWQSLSGGGRRVSLGITSSQLTHLSFGAFRWALSVEKQRRAKDFRTRGRHLSDHPLQTLCFSFLLFHNIISPKCIGWTATTIYLLMTLRCCQDAVVGEDLSFWFSCTWPFSLHMVAHHSVVNLSIFTWRLPSQRQKTVPTWPPRVGSELASITFYCPKQVAGQPGI